MFEELEGCGPEPEPIRDDPTIGHITYDPAKPDDYSVMYTNMFNGRLYVFHKNSTWASPPPSRPRRLHRWLVRLWRGAVAWVVQREQDDA